MSDLCRLIWCGLIELFRPRCDLEAENLVLRHQLNVLRRKAPKRVALGSIDRLLLVGLYRLAPGVLDALKIIRPETLIRWHRAGFRAFWRWKSRPRGGRPSIPVDIRCLIREMSVANPLWGAPRIHGELVLVGNSCSDVLVVQAAQDGHRERLTDGLDGARNRRVLLQRQMRAGLVVIFLI